MFGGGVIAYPTEAVYGIGCLPYDDAALERVLALKRRHPAKGLILIAASIDQVDEFAILPGGDRGRQIRADWPGPVTWIVPARDSVAPAIGGGRGTVAMRVTAHPVARALCEAVGSAIVSTSANVSGHSPIREKTRLRNQLGRAVDMIVPGAPGDRARPTAIRDAGTGATIRAD